VSETAAHSDFSVYRRLRSLLTYLCMYVHACTSFAVAAPTTWNSLPEYLRDPKLSIDSFFRQLKTFVCSVLKRTLAH